MDGHDYIEAAAANGAKAALASKEIDAPLPMLRVDDVRSALAAIAAHIRSGFTGPVIGVTGSMGKTTVKEFIAAGLDSQGRVLKSEGNQNTEFGLPMTWIRLEPEHKYAVLEMGMRGRGQIAHLASFSCPTVGVITALGSAHVGELGSLQAIAEAKSELLSALHEEGLAVIPSEGQFDDVLRAAAKCRVATFGNGPGAGVRVNKSVGDTAKNLTAFAVEVKGQTFEGEVPGLGDHQAKNAAAAIAVFAGLGLPLDECINFMARAKVPGLRLHAKDFNGATLLIDIYNSSPESCIESLRVLASTPTEGSRVAILGDMLELGECTERAHREIGAEASRLRLDRLSLVGRAVHWTREEAIKLGFEGRIDHYGSAEEAARAIAALEPGDVLLIKGSRGMELEKTLAAAGVPIDG
jgi:UDP-N-acetylmuramoyl-tripeptide--D-alanyl-D-alanine ligase